MNATRGLYGGYGGRYVPETLVPALDDLERARAAEGRIMLAGGLGPENVRAAIDTVHPWAVDASSRLERSPGVKDHARVHAYVEAAR